MALLLLLLPETPFLGTNNNPPERTNFEVGNRKEEMGFRDLSVQDRQVKSSRFGWWKLVAAAADDMFYSTGMECKTETHREPFPKFYVYFGLD